MATGGDSSPTGTETERLRRELVRARGRMARDVAEMRVRVRRVTSVGERFRRRPLLVLGAAAMLGFVLYGVRPRRRLPGVPAGKGMVAAIRAGITALILRTVVGAVESKLKQALTGRSRQPL